MRAFAEGKKKRFFSKTSYGSKRFFLPVPHLLSLHLFVAGAAIADQFLFASSIAGSKTFAPKPFFACFTKLPNCSVLLQSRSGGYQNLNDHFDTRFFSFNFSL